MSLNESYLLWSPNQYFISRLILLGNIFCWHNQMLIPQRNTWSLRHHLMLIDYRHFEMQSFNFFRYDWPYLARSIILILIDGSIYHSLSSHVHRLFWLLVNLCVGWVHLPTRNLLITQPDLLLDFKCLIVLVIVLITLYVPF